MVLQDARSVRSNLRSTPGFEACKAAFRVDMRHLKLLFPLLFLVAAVAACDAPDETFRLVTVESQDRLGLSLRELPEQRESECIARLPCLRRRRGKGRSSQAKGGHGIKQRPVHEDHDAMPHGHMATPFYRAPR